jgi:hypothetical protein
MENYFDADSFEPSVDSYIEPKAKLILKRPSAYPTPTIYVNHLGIFKRIGKAIGNAGKFVAKEAAQGAKFVGKEAVQGAKFVAKEVGQIAGFAILLPFMPLMKAALRKKGVSSNNNPSDVAQLFYNNIIHPNSFEPYINFDQMPAYDPANHADVVDVIQGVKTGTPIDIIPPVIKFVKDLISKKSSGQNLPPTLDAIATEATAIQATLDKKVKKSGKTPKVASNQKSYAPYLASKPNEVMGKDAPATLNQTPVTSKPTTIIQPDQMGLTLKSPLVLAGIAGVVLVIIIAVAKR